jgi:hypothetical protein
MERDAKDSSSRVRHQRTLYTILFWGALALLIYFMSIGPVIRYYDKRPGLYSGSTKFLEMFYRPVDWLYEKTPLHKPIGMYLSLWSKRFGRDGETTD